MAKGKVRLSPADLTSKWIKRTKAAIPDAIAGVNAVTDDPGEAAIAKQDKLLANLTESIQNGTWAKRRREVTLDEWKKITTSKMQTRLAGGVDAAQVKRQKFDTWLVNTLNGVLPDIKAMPDMTIEDSINRVGALIRYMNKNRYKKST